MRTSKILRMKAMTTMRGHSGKNDDCVLGDSAPQLRLSEHYSRVVALPPFLWSVVAGTWTSSTSGFFFESSWKTLSSTPTLVSPPAHPQALSFSLIQFGLTSISSGILLRRPRLSPPPKKILRVFSLDIKNVKGQQTRRKKEMAEEGGGGGGREAEKEPSSLGALKAALRVVIDVGNNSSDDERRGGIRMNYAGGPLSIPQLFFLILAR